MTGRYGVASPLQLGATLVASRIMRVVDGVVRVWPVPMQWVPHHPMVRVTS